MLKLAERADLARIAGFCEGSLLGTYLACRAACYKTDVDFVRFWYAADDSGLHAVIGALEDTAVLLADDAADAEELACFLRMQHFLSVMTDDVTARRCGLPVREAKTAFRFDGMLSPDDGAAHDADMKSVYRLIAASIPNSFADTKDAYLRFLSDFTFRKNRGAARLRAVTQDGAVLACALTAAESETAAVLSGVAVHPAARRQGLGRRVVTSMLHALASADKTAYVIALNPSAEAFYRRLGFCEEQTIVYLDTTTET